MKKFYIQDTTIGRFVTFETVSQLVGYLNQLIPRAFGISRDTYVQNLIDLGHGYDDPRGVMITRLLSEQFNIGVIKNDSFVRTDIHAVESFQNSEYGD